MLSTSEYLSTSYRSDQELIDGRLIERNVGEYDHSNLLGALIAWLEAGNANGTFVSYRDKGYE